MDGHKARVFAVHFHPADPFTFLSGGWDDTVQYWDVRKQRSFRQVSGALLFLTIRIFIHS